MRTNLLLLLRQFFAAAILFLAWTSFGQQPERGTDKEPAKVRTSYMREEALAKLVSTNMSKQQVLAKFGKPDETHKHDREIDVWDFTFNPDPKDDGAKRFIAVGLTVVWRGEQMIRWSPQYGITGGKTPSEFMKEIKPAVDAGNPSTTNRDFTFWVVSDKRIEGGRYIDTPSMKALGWISSQPQLRVTQIQSASAGHELVDYDGKGPSDQYRHDVSLLPKDAESFKKLTTENVGKNVLMMLGDRPLIAPRVNSPISGGKFVVTSDDKKSFDELRAELGWLIKPQ